MNEELMAQLREVMREVAEEVLGEVRQEQSQMVGTMLAEARRLDNGGRSKEVKGADAARIVRALAATKGDPERAARFVRTQWGDDHEKIAKALESGTDAAGGFIVPPSYSTEIIELLYPMTVVRGSGAVVVPMDNGTISMPKLTGGVTAQYVGENQNIGVDQPDFGTLDLVWKKLACIVPISNDLLRFANPSADRVVRDDLVTSMALREDLAFIRDDGTGQKPMGMRYWCPNANLIPMTASTTPTLAQVRGDLSKLQLALEGVNSRMLRPGWIFTPRTKHYLLNLADGNGNFAYKTEMDNGMLYGYRFKTTTQLPQNLGAGTNESEIYFVDFADAIIGEASQLIIDASGEAAYYDGAAVQAAFSRDQTLIRAIARHDFGMRHDSSVAIGTGVTWGG